MPTATTTASTSRVLHRREAGATYVSAATFDTCSTVRIAGIGATFGPAPPRGCLSWNSTAVCVGSGSDEWNTAVLHDFGRAFDRLWRLRRQQGHRVRLGSEWRARGGQLRDRRVS